MTEKLKFGTEGIWYKPKNEESKAKAIPAVVLEDDGVLLYIFTHDKKQKTLTARTATIFHRDFEADVKCSACDDMLSHIVASFSDEDGTYIVPTRWAETIKDLKAFYKKETGGDYFEDTGNKMEDDFYKTVLDLSHCCADDEGYDAVKEHKFLAVECWSNA